MAVTLMGNVKWAVQCIVHSLCAAENLTFQLLFGMFLNNGISYICLTLPKRGPNMAGFLGGGGGGLRKKYTMFQDFNR
jgi:hypothetical protein